MDSCYLRSGILQVVGHTVIVICILQGLVRCTALFEDKKEDRLAALALLGLTDSRSNGTFTVDRNGGTFQSDDGLFRIIIPEGAMDETETFTIERHNASMDSFPSGLPTTKAYELSPSYRFRKNVIVEMTLDTNTMAHLGLSSEDSIVYSHSETGLHEGDPSSEIGVSRRLPGWSALSTEVLGDKLRATTKSFSIFGGATATGPNRPPRIGAGYYYFKPGCQRLPYKVRARIIEPDGDPMEVYLVTGEKDNGTILIPMDHESGDWYAGDLPYEVMGTTGLQIQILAFDDTGANTTLPLSQTFVFPDNGSHPQDSTYDPIDDNIELNCAWVKDHPGGDPTDTDGDGVPDSHDSTPNGESTPVLTEYRILPETITMEPGEVVTFGTLALDSGIPQVVVPDYSASANIGELDGSRFTATTPGSGSITSTSGSYSDNASIIVLDTIAPANVIDLAAIAVDHNSVELSWTAPGNNGNQGQAQNYEIRYSTSEIGDEESCDNGSGYSHGLTPKSAGSPETLLVTSLIPETRYYFCIRAIDSEGNRSVWTDQVDVMTTPAPDLTPPAEITDATAQSSGTNSILLRWNAVGDDGVDGFATGYEIKKSTSTIASDAVCNSAIPVANSIMPATPGALESLNISDLSEDTTYFFCIRALDEAGNKSPWNSTLSAFTENANDPPIAEAGEDSTWAPGDTVSLSGEITDPDAGRCNANVSNYSYFWTFDSVPPESNLINGDIVGRNSLNASFEPDTIGEYTLSLHVTDDAGLCEGIAMEDTDSVTITVSWAGYEFRNSESGYVSSYQFGRYFWENNAAGGQYLLWNLSNANTTVLGRYNPETGWTLLESLPFGLPYIVDLTIAGSDHLILAQIESSMDNDTLYTREFIPGAGWQPALEHPVPDGTQLRSVYVQGSRNGSVRMVYLERSAEPDATYEIREKEYEPGNGWQSPVILEDSTQYMEIMDFKGDPVNETAVAVYYVGNSDLLVKRLHNGSWEASESVGTRDGALRDVEARIDSEGNIAIFWAYTTGEYPQWEGTVRLSYYDAGAKIWTKDLLIDSTGAEYGRHYLSLSFANGTGFASWQKLGTDGAQSFCEFSQFSITGGVEAPEHIALCREICIAAAPGGHGVAAYIVQNPPSYDKDLRMQRYFPDTKWGVVQEDFDQSSNSDVSLQNCKELPNDPLGRILVPWMFNNYSGGDTEHRFRYLD
ncbi:MAG: fibronectin type III domain-containing protein [Leptospiraceae bacterium]